jgi:opacity protein-like surface antigen
MVMMKRQWLHRILAGAGLVMLTAASAGAQVVQVSRGDSRNAIGFTIGGFLLRGEDGRINENDVLFEDLHSADFPHYLFDIKDFNNVTFGGEYLFAVSDYLEAGVGAGFYQKEVNSIYADVVHANQSEIEQRLKLRIVPITATIRFLPVGRSAPVQPYVGAGVGFFNWRYSEVGEFVESNNDILDGAFRSDGTAVGPVILAGVRFPLGDALTAGGEVRWQSAKGDTGGIDQGFLGDKIVLSGTTANFTIHFRF